MSEPDLPETNDTRYVLYNFDTGQLVTTQLFDTYAEAADAIDHRLQNILIVAVVIPTTDDDVSDEKDSDQPCDCERPGFFHCGVPGIVAHFENGRLAPGALVERCDRCERYPTDDAARQKLIELGRA